MSWYILLIALAVFLIVQAVKWSWLALDKEGMASAYHNERVSILTLGFFNITSIVVAVFSLFTGLWGLV